MTNDRDRQLFVQKDNIDNPEVAHGFVWHGTPPSPRVNRPFPIYDAGVTI